VSDSIIIQQPAQSAQQLLVLHHGVGGSAQYMVPVGQQLAAQFPNAFIVSVQAPHAFDAGGGDGGGQWFSVQGITEQNRAARVAQALPAFVQDLKHWQAQSGVPATATAVMGFSQGAIMALEAVQAEPALAGRVIAVGGRYASLPEQAPQDVCLHLLHGMADTVLPYQGAVTAAKALVQLGADVTADVLPEIGHELHPGLVAQAMLQLRTFVPAKVWREAMQAAQAQGLVPKV
jgi:phospholipase/carboxylesterase